MLSKSTHGATSSFHALPSSTLVVKTRSPKPRSTDSMNADWCKRRGTLSFQSSIEQQRLGQSKVWSRLMWGQCILGMALPCSLEEFGAIWSLIRGTVLWTLWIAINARVFRNERWPQD